MTRNYTPPNQLPNLEQWAAARETNLAVATAIHAIADDKRTPDAIWQEPTIAEVDHVMTAVDEYISHGDFPAEDDGRYIWGSLTITLGMPSILDHGSGNHARYHHCGGTILTGPDNVYCDRCRAVIYYGDECEYETWEAAFSALRDEEEE